MVNQRVTPDRKPYARAWASCAGNKITSVYVGVSRQQMDGNLWPGERVVRVEIRPVKRKKARRG